MATTPKKESYEITLLRIALCALNEMPNKSIYGRQEWPKPFDGKSSSYDLAHTINMHLKEHDHAIQETDQV